MCGESVLTWYDLFVALDDNSDGSLDAHDIKKALGAVCDVGNDQCSTLLDELKLIVHLLAASRGSIGWIEWLAAAEFSSMLGRGNTKGAGTTTMQQTEVVCSFVHRLPWHVNMTIPACLEPAIVVERGISYVDDGARQRETAIAQSPNRPFLSFFEICGFQSCHTAGAVQRQAQQKQNTRIVNVLELRPDDLQLLVKALAKPTFAGDEINL